MRVEIVLVEGLRTTPKSGTNYCAGDLKGCDLAAIRLCAMSLRESAAGCSRQPPAGCSGVVGGLGTRLTSIGGARKKRTIPRRVL